MDDMSAFERQVEARLQHLAGPEPSVDVMASVRAATSTSARWRFPSMSSATRLVLAAVLVTLFGGLLLSGALTQPSQETVPGAASPMTTAGLLSASVTEQVEPGVLRVLNDGVQDLTWPLPDRSDTETLYGVKVGFDGSVWLTEPDGLRRFSDEQFIPVGGEDGPEFFGYSKVGADGTLWMATDDALWYVGTDPSSPGEAGWRQWELEGGMRLADSGGFWQVSESPETVVLTRGPTDGDGWQSLEVPRPSPGGNLVYLDSDDGSVWIMAEDDGLLLRFDGTEWKTHRIPGGLSFTEVQVGGDSTAWMMLSDGNLARFDGIEWLVFDRSGKASGYRDDAFHDVSPDGSLWQMGPGCTGLRRFDGSRWATYLQDLCITTMAMGRDGAVWARGHDAAAGGQPSGSATGSLDLYVITPEAVAAAE